MARSSVFDEAWRACLREQYKYVVRNNDSRTLESLTQVLTEVGFGEEELRELYVLASMRAEDMPADFVPDMDVAAPDEPPVFPAAQLEPAADDAPVAESAPPVAEMESAPEPESDDADDDPQQLSLFG